MFLEQLGQISNRIRGTLALSLVDRDGIPIESVNTQPSINLEELAAEMVAQVRTMESTYDELASGGFRQCSISTSDLTLVISSLVNGYYLLLVLDREVGLGQARFELRRARWVLEPELT